MSVNLRILRSLWTLIAIAGGNLLVSAAVHAQNVAPVVSGTPPASVRPGQTYDFQPTATDANGDAIRWRVSNRPRWAAFDKRTGRLHGKPTSRDIGRWRSIRIAASDGKLSSALPPFMIEVGVIDGAAPSISGIPASTGRETEFYAFLPTSSDPNGGTLTFSIKNKPSWATFDGRSGLLSGIPAVGTAGTYANIQIKVTDGSGARSLPPFSVTIGPAANHAPTISGTPATTAKTGQTYSFRPTASDPDGQKLQFSILGQPGWAAFDATTGALSGTPGPGDVGTYANIILVAKDGVTSAMLAPFTVTVTKSNSAPTVSGVPSGTAIVGQAYAFLPSAADADGQALSFSIKNQPAWATFDPATGRLSGSPGTTAIGTYSNIVISVSDGQASASLPGYSIVVKSASVAGSAKLSWVPPTQKVDDTPITNLAGFKIRYGQSSAALDQVLDVASPVITSAMVENLAAGTWYFAIQAYTTDGVESDPSNLAQKTIN